MEEGINKADLKRGLSEEFKHVLERSGVPNGTCRSGKVVLER
jgi:hypothetical protein